MENEKLKVINVHFQFSPYGGGEVIAYNNYKILKEHGHDVYFFCIDKKPYFEEDYKYTKYFVKPYKKKDGFFNYVKNICRVYYNTDYAKEFAKMLDEVKPDIVHVHTFGFLTISILKPCIDRKIPIVKTEHSTLIACPAESMFFRNETFCKKHLCVRGNYFHCILNKCCQNNYYSSFVGALTNAICDLTGYYNKVSRFIIPSKALKNIVKEKGIKENKISVIENFLDNKFRNSEISHNNGEYFLYSGRLYNFKGLKILINAINKLPKDIPFHIAGTGPMEDELKEYCKNKNLDNVQFLGFLSQERLIEEYRNCIATIVPSTCFEIFGLIVIEAMALGKPVIVSDIGALSEIIIPNKTGLIFAPENSDQLKECILEYWENKALAVQHGNYAYKIANENYNEDKYYENLMNVYREVINGYGR